MNLSENLRDNMSILGFKHPRNIFPNLPVSELMQHSLDKGEGYLTENGTLCINTGKFTGRSPKDRYIVKDNQTQENVDWGAINKGISKETYDTLKTQLIDYFEHKDIYVKEVAAGASKKHQINVRVYCEKPWSAHFADNMFINLDEEKLADFKADWTVINGPGFHADEAQFEDLCDTNFAILNFSEKTIIIGGTGYTGEIKKGIFSALNFLYPFDSILPMHCSCNVGENGDTSLFFGLSGTGKTTLSSDPNRHLVGDDEHGWSSDGVFNFEGGCYAKCIDLTQEKEPDIFMAIKPGALLENILPVDGTKNVPDYSNGSITQNIRVSYPLTHIPKRVIDSTAGIPQNIFFLTCDAFGVLPPISKLNKEQAMYHFVSGYTAKVAGTELGITEPQETFSACFGAPFLPWHPMKYAEMLGEKIDQYKANIWLVNTGWIAGSYGTGSRISLKYTRQLLTSAIQGDLDGVEYGKLPLFDLAYPTKCPGVPTKILNPRNAWSDKGKYDQTAQKLYNMFESNYTQFT